MFTDNNNVTNHIRRKSDGYILETRTESLSKVSILTLINVDVNSTGTYNCTATQRDGKNFSATVPIFVRGKSIILTP